ncbi:hypothetical protein CONPUDRAFT_165862 [Coniophora puteana RWD-64-598 SS2]|uniref:Pali-domain-containing protein n=1 Tax=Coniophora puteana (strain RWD-64-598) TaxID=741705 RepID=A0A5M3MNE3_CONPW|nr:uncharacterized protein CONPUDRAFT_165862 [Coniophora puteana RWD-64-598 SS2]EIW80294.1 hypothetical protein CONPUDRAFT_165862 [Coniophora puteana RWD-64-598 SS2]
MAPTFFSRFKSSRASTTPAASKAKTQTIVHREHRFIAAIVFFLIFAFFLLLLLVSLSSSIIKRIFVFEVYAVESNDPSVGLSSVTRFGMWGVCASAPNITICNGPSLGYEIPYDVLTNMGINDGLGPHALRVLQSLLIFHVACAAFSFILLFMVPFLHIQPIAVGAFFLALITALLGTAALAADIAFTLFVKTNIGPLTPELAFKVDFGNATWMVLAGDFLIWGAVIVLMARMFFCFGIRQPRKKTIDVEKPALS